MRIHHVQIMVPEERLEEARAYYQDLLGLVPISRPEADSGRPGLWFSCGDLELHLGTGSGPVDPTGRAHVAFAVPRLSELRSRLLTRNFEVRDGMAAGGLRFHTRDPFGNRLEFLEDPAPPRA